MGDDRSAARYKKKKFCNVRDVGAIALCEVIKSFKANKSFFLIVKFSSARETSIALINRTQEQVQQQS